MQNAQQIHQPQQAAPAAVAESGRSLDGAPRLIAYADPWTTPPEAFYDIYDLLPRLSNPDAHLEMEGRRGTGKTVLMVNSYLKLRQQFEERKGSPPYTVAIYIDLSQDVGSPRSEPPLVRGCQLYTQILKLILTASLRPGHRRDRRFWGLQDYLDERPHWFRRVYARWRLDRYRTYVDSIPSLLEQDALFQAMLKSLRGERPSGAFSAANFRMARLAVPKGQAAQPAATHPRNRSLPSIVYEKRVLSLYRDYGAQARDLLEAVLDALQVDKLILFVDEWSGPSIGSETQPFLYEQLAHTFLPAGRVVLRLATIPGATKLTFESSTTHVPAVYLDQLATFQPNWMRKRLLRLLILNLKASIGARFPGDAYLAPDQDQQGYPHFLRDVFANEAAADELAYASESLPRQMLIQFMAAAQLRGLLGGQRKLTAGLIRMAAREHFATQLAVTVRQDAVVSAVFDEILKAGCRVVDVERVPMFYEALDWLVNEGIIFRCEAISGQENTLVDGFLRYKLSYPAEVYRLGLAQPQNVRNPAYFEQLALDPLVYGERYPKPPQVMLAPLSAALLQPAAA
jgi:hypothetical protein